MTKLQSELEQITSSVVDARSKPHLRPAIHSALTKLEHDEDAIQAELDKFFAPERTLQ